MMSFGSLFMVINFTMLIANAAVTTVHSMMIYKEVKNAKR